MIQKWLNMAEISEGCRPPGILAMDALLLLCIECVQGHPKGVILEQIVREKSLHLTTATHCSCYKTSHNPSIPRINFILSILMSSRCPENASLH